MITSTGNGRRALVVGLGISGLSTAISLRRAGWEPVVVERAPARRTEGYFIGLFGAGTAAAARLGFLGDLADRASRDGSIHEVDRSGRGRRCVGFHELPGTPRVLLRGDVEAAAYRALPPGVAIRFATVPTAIEQDPDGVEVTLRDTATGRSGTERFDLVVGADGVRSAVRALAFGPAGVHVRRLNYMVGAVKLARPVPGFRPGDGAVLAEVGRSMWLFPFTGTTPAALFSYRTTDVAAEFTAPPIDRLRAAFGPEPPGALLEAVFAEYERAERPLFDSAEQIRLDRWHRGRVVLLGDSAWCMTLYSGMGASTGMAAAQLLGTLLARYPVADALDRWERRLRPFVAYHQREAVRQRQFFTPASRLERVARSTVLCGLKSPRSGGFFRWLLDTTAGKAQRMKAMDISAAGAPETVG
ncbi:FAD-dependent monooxygenase [Amycolatopsis sp. 195334CR]|uniref:FAD-dependent monooxygenase n=1 Tax=Amycolatopsis sp. 195334CR TaxID=2814588 RepID=UPI001A8F13E6|nr:FAD-dependent monooxygenase [Amycolatopsis sp. 195334CR]MBN6040612.1 FAD-dependent monooxygenase [Amycolatopsis sp. 195334CR]